MQGDGKGGSRRRVGVRARWLLLLLLLVVLMLLLLMSMMILLLLIQFEHCEWEWCSVASDRARGGAPMLSPPVLPQRTYHHRAGA